MSNATNSSNPYSRLNMVEAVVKNVSESAPKGPTNTVTLTVDGDALIVRAPYNPKFNVALKQRVHAPKYCKKARTWTVARGYLGNVERMVKRYYGESVSV